MESRKIFPVDPRFPDQETLKKAAHVIKKGGIVVFPTGSFYGLGASAFNRNAVSRVYQAKERRSEKPLLILIAASTQLSSLVRSIPKAAEKLIRAFWPGNLTIVFQAGRALPGNLTGHTGKVGIRLAAHPVAVALVRETECPITATSANLSGQTGSTTVSELEKRLTAQVDIIVDAGRLPGGKGSTVVDITVEPVHIIREGVVSSRDIMSVLEGKAITS